MDGDSDAELRWGGEAAADAEPLLVEALVAPNDDGRTLNTLATPSPVRTLQLQLIELGFTFVRRAAPGVVDRLTRWGIREFQIYARMPVVARQTRAAAAGTSYVDTLQPVQLTHRYDGPVGGARNPATLRAIEHWRRHNLRCPVVVSAYTGAGRVVNENIWLHDEVTTRGVRMYVRDFTEYYPLPPGRSRTELISAGVHTSSGGRFNGPVTMPPRSCWPEAEMLPETLAGAPLHSLTPAQRSTFKVVRAVAEVECFGFFDCINAWDNAFVSLGPCHWTLGIVFPSSVAGGELCGYLAYLRHSDPAAFTHAVEFFGTRSERGWNEDGGPLFDPGARKYAGWMAVQGEDGSYAPVERREEELNYFKGWHWFYRFLMAARTLDGFRRGMWRMARMRLRDILGAPWSSTPGDARIGDIFTSERAVAMILRWHVYRPGHMVASGRAGARLRNARSRAAAAAPGLNWRLPPARWTDAHERALVQALRDEGDAAGGNLESTLGQVDRWPAWRPGANPRGYRLDPAIGRLSDARGSFRLDDGGLPDAPY
jgi:hypothetical protein